MDEPGCVCVCVWGGGGVGGSGSDLGRKPEYVSWPELGLWRWWTGDRVAVGKSGDGFAIHGRTASHVCTAVYEPESRRVT